MADVRLTIAGRHYDVHCSDGQEQQLLTLGAMVDEKAQGAVGTTEIRQLLFSALFLADELKDARNNAPKVTPESESLREQLAAAEAREAALQSEMQALRDEAQKLREQSQEQMQQHVQQLAETQAALQAAHVALTEAEVLADNAVDQAQQARADADAAAQLLNEMQAQNGDGNIAADAAKAASHAKALSHLADRIESLADTFEELS